MRSSALMLAADNARRHSSVEETALEQRGALERFLAGVEKRAFRLALFAVRSADDALDIVQEAMLRLVRHYAAAPPDEWRVIFFRILRNRIVDHQRRSAVRLRFLSWWWPPASGVEDDPVMAAPGPDHDRPESQVASAGAIAALEQAVRALPARQQQAFLLRAMEGLEVSETAVVMGCSEGSVKTHYARAVRSLRATLGEHWP